MHTTCIQFFATSIQYPGNKKNSDDVKDYLMIFDGKDFYQTNWRGIENTQLVG